MDDKKEKIHDGKEYGLRAEASEFPMMGVLSFVYPCNALCPHCPYTNSNIRKEFKDAPYMPEHTFKLIADEFGKYNAMLRISGGGEPMLHPKGTELLVYAKKVGAKIGLITNGSKFDEKNSRELLTSNVDTIEFSVDANNEEDYKVVRKGLNWHVLLENVERMIRLRKDLSSTTKIIASGVNQKQVKIDEVEDFWVNAIGVDYFIKRKFLTWGEHTRLDDSRSADPAAYLNTDEIPCPFIFERLNIDSRGNVMVCGYDISSKTSMGNIHETSIREIWHGEGFQHYRSMHLANRGKEISMCATCPDWKYRSWDHNYWKVLRGAEENRIRKSGMLSEHDDFQAQAE